jgi:hypothetical protein
VIALAQKYHPHFIIVVMQRVHLNDLSGYLMESGGWTVLSLPAIAEQDETIAIGDEAAMIPRDWLRYYDQPPEGKFNLLYCPDRKAERPAFS